MRYNPYNKNAYKRQTRTGNRVFRIYVDTNEILSHLEQGKCLIAYDIQTVGGMIKTITGSKNGQQWEAIQYQVWARTKDEAKEEVPTTVVAPIVTV